MNKEHGEMKETTEFEAAARAALRHPAPQPGDKVSGVVVSIGESHAFVDVGAKAEAAIALEELMADGELRVSVGDTLEGYVVEVEPEFLLSQVLSRRHADISGIEQAREMGLPVKGTVKGVNKGGLEVDLGGVRAFCPLSQIDLQRVEQPEQYLGQSYDFKVMEVKDGGRTVVVSRRALLEERRQVEAAEVRQKMQPGAAVDGVVISLQPYGAFIDLGGGIQGMVHVSEISRSRIEHPDDVLAVGQHVQAKILTVEADPKRPTRLRIAMSIKALLGNAWDEAAASLQEGDVVEGKVVRLQPFGVFVELLPGVDGLVHISELSDRRIGHPSEVVSLGQMVEVTVLKLDPGAKRISLSLRGGGASAPRGGYATEDDTLGSGHVYECQIERVKPFGLLVSYRGPGRGRGLIPADEAGVEDVSDLRRTFNEGDTVLARVIEIDDEGKVKLSISACDETEPREEIPPAFYDYEDEPPEHARSRKGRGRDRGRGGERHRGDGDSRGGGFGTLGDLLKGALDKS